MIKGGKGGDKTKTGLTFEKRSNLRELFSIHKGYTSEKGNLFFNGQLVAQMYKKNDLYKHFLEIKGIKYEERISKKLLPDETIFVIGRKTLFIIEIKFQEVEGSVDEKLQTCDFKKKQYIKLLKGTGIEVEYVYILNDWFRDNRYIDVLNYIKSVGCHYFFETLPFEFLGLPSQ
jgi:hypothetical protein